MSGNNGAPSVPPGPSRPRPRRIITASSKLTDPHNTAELIPSHKHAIELKRAAELANKRLGDTASGGSSPPDSSPSGHQYQSSLSTPPPPTVSPFPEARTNANKSNSSREDGGESGDEPIERRKQSLIISH